MSQLTVCICTHNRALVFRDCLESLVTELAANGSAISILIIDNVSTDETAEICTEFAARYSKLRYYYYGELGVSAARNYALSVADTEWLVFLDDDALVQAGWLDRLLWNIGQDDCELFGGMYGPWYRDGKAWWYPNRFGTNASWMPFKDRTLIHDPYYVSSGIMALKRQFVVDAGGFDPALGMKGRDLGYHGENQMQALVRKAGGRIIYDPHWVMLHWVPLRKQTFQWFVRRAYTEGQDMIRIAGPRAGNARSLCLLGAKCVLSLIRDVVAVPIKAEKDRYFLATVVLLLTIRSTARLAQLRTAFKMRSGHM